MHGRRSRSARARDDRHPRECEDRADRERPGRCPRSFWQRTKARRKSKASHLLVAAGRRANVDDLGLDEAGIKYERRGVIVDKGLRTSNKRVYAIGDVAGGLQFTHAANYHAGLVIRNALFRLPVSANDALVPRVTFTDPELAHAGLTEAQARERHKKIAVLRWPFHENDRAQTERDTHGHIKVIATSRR